LTARIREVRADVVICEIDFFTGEVLELPLRAIGITRDDPINVDIAAATKRGIPVLHTLGPECGCSRGTQRRGGGRGVRPFRWRAPAQRTRIFT
jgi:hypothetical protein